MHLVWVSTLFILVFASFFMRCSKLYSVQSPLLNCLLSEHLWTQRTFLLFWQLRFRPLSLSLSFTHSAHTTQHNWPFSIWALPQIAMVTPRKYCPLSTPHLSLLMCSGGISKSATQGKNDPQTSLCLVQIAPVLLGVVGWSVQFVVLVPSCCCCCGKTDHCNSQQFQCWAAHTKQQSLWERWGRMWCYVGLRDIETTQQWAI